jgi:DNA helicase II / ATP-dependent DNA helicase PcrA
MKSATNSQIDATAEHHGEDLERNLLWVACTRAMHRLLLTHAGAPIPLLPDPARDERGA